MKTADIRTGEPFESLFPIDGATLGRVIDNMRTHGYDMLHPITIWTEGNVVIDGHTRLVAAQELALDVVPIVRKSFPSEDAAVEYAISCQRDRRNATDADLIRWLAEVDKRKTHSEAGAMKGEKPASSEAISRGKSAESTAKLLGISRAKAERTRAVLDRASSKVKAQVASGKKSINRAYSDLRADEIAAQDAMAEADVDDAAAHDAYDDAPETEPDRTDEFERICGAMELEIRRNIAGGWEFMSRDYVIEKLSALFALADS